MTENTRDEIKRQKLRQVIEGHFDPDRAPRLSPAMHAAFDELHTGTAQAECVRRAMRNASNLADSTIRTRLHELMNAGFIRFTDHGVYIEVLDLPKARR